MYSLDSKHIMKLIIISTVLTLLGTLFVEQARPNQTDGIPKFEEVEVKPLEVKLASIENDTANTSSNIQQKDPVVPPVSSGGTKEQWMSAAGIPQDQWGYVDSIVSRESGWNPNAINASSGACGLGQQLPCGKWAGAWNDPVAALQAQYQYVIERYGGYAGAVAFWNANSWY